MAAKSRCWTLQPSPPRTTGYLLVAHCVITGDSFFEVCHEEYGVDLRRKLFRCDRQVTYILKGGYQGHKRHTFLNRLITGAWSLKTMTYVLNVYFFHVFPVTLHVCLAELFFCLCTIHTSYGFEDPWHSMPGRLISGVFLSNYTFPGTRGCRMRAMHLSCTV